MNLGTLLLILVPLAIAVRASCRRDGIELNHVLLFSFGFVFYWIVPVAVGLVRPLADDRGLKLWYDFFDGVRTSGGMSTYLWAAALSYGAFIVGSAAGYLLPALQPRVLSGLSFSGRALLPLLVPAAVLSAIYAAQLRDQFFTGYQSLDRASFLVRGTFTATTLLLLDVLLLSVAAKDRAGTAPSIRRLLRGPYVIAYGAAALLILSLGGRLYLLTGILAVGTYVTVYRRRIGYVWAASAAITVVVLSALVGTVRYGGAPSLLGAAANAFAEPLFTSFSLLSFVGAGDFPMIAFPRFLLSDLLNLIPTALFPDKASLMLRPEQFGYVIFSPFGAQHAFVSFTINFGLVGTALVLFLFGLTLSRLKRSDAPLLRVIYVLLTACLAFTFFRDPFYTSAVKNMLQFSVLMPWMLTATAHVLTVVGRPAKRRAAA